MNVLQSREKMHSAEVLRAPLSLQPLPLHPVATHGRALLSSRTGIRVCGKNPMTFLMLILLLTGALPFLVLSLSV